METIGFGTARRILLPVLMMTALLVPATPAQAAGLFTDDDGSFHEDDIDLIAANGITKGCGTDLYCPDDVVTRAQMASFLVRALGLPPGSGDHFPDVDGPHAADIDALADAGITSGYPDGTYRPSEAVTRGQMATFLAAGFSLPAAESPFPDTGSVHAAGIGAVAAAGVASGYVDGTFRPAIPVTRAQMATFLVNALDQQAAPAPSIPELPPPLDDPELPPVDELAFTASALTWQRTGALHCSNFSGQPAVTAPTIHGSGYYAWIPQFFYLDSNGTYHGAFSYGEWEWSYGAQPTGIATAPSPWRRFSDGAVGGMQVTNHVPGHILVVRQWVYDYDSGQWSWAWARSAIGANSFCVVR